MLKFEFRAEENLQILIFQSNYDYKYKSIIYHNSIEKLRSV